LTQFVLSGASRQKERKGTRLIGAASPSNVMEWVMQMHFLVWIATLVALPALAQAPGVAADPADAKAVSPAPQYRSAFADYRAWREPELTNWRSANDEVAAVGGHMGHVRGQASVRAIPGATATPGTKPEPLK
jgi:hypothetical protein